MMPVLYIGFPAIIGFVALLVLTRIYLNVGSQSLQTKVSFSLAWLQFGFAFLANFFTYQNSISAPACLLGIFGFYISSAVVLADGLNLFVWLWEKLKESGSWFEPQPMLFVVLRLFIHGAFISAFLWSALLCTV